MISNLKYKLAGALALMLFSFGVLSWSAIQTQRTINPYFHNSLLSPNGPPSSNGSPFPSSSSSPNGSPFRNRSSAFKLPVIGKVAPDFTLADAKGKKRVTLSHLKGRPIVLIFGSITCPYFTNSAQSIERFYHNYKNKAHIYAIYISEAHPGGSMNHKATSKDIPAVLQASEMQERRKAASLLINHFKLSVPLLVDAMDNRVKEIYHGFPTCVYVINSKGIVAYTHFDPASLFSPAVQKLIS